MSFEQYIYSRLSAYSGLTDLVSTRISPHKSLQGSAFPCVTYTSTQEFEFTHDARDLTSQVSLQVDAWGTSKETARAVYQQVLSALANDAAGVFVVHKVGVTAMYEDETDRYRYSIQFGCLYTGTD